MRIKNTNWDLIELLNIYNPGQKVILGKHTAAFAASLAASNSEIPAKKLSIADLRKAVAASLEGQMLRYPSNLTATSFSENEIGGLRYYLFKHKNAAAVPTLLMFYGGGFCLNTMAAHKAFMANIAAKTECNIILPDYPLAPETKAPEIIAKVDKFVEALLSSAVSCGVSENFILMGWSSGANTALTAVLNLQKKIPRLFRKISQMILLSSWIDLSMQVLTKGPYQTQQNADTIAAGAEPLTQMSKWYLPVNAVGNEPQFCPAARAAAELRDLPLISVIAGSSEVLLGDSIFLVNALSNAGAPVQLIILEGQTHNYLVFNELSRDGVFVPELVAAIIENKHIDNMIGKDNLGLVVKRFNRENH